MNTCSTIEWLSVNYSSFMLRRNFLFFNFGRDVSIVWHVWQWVTVAQMSGSQWVTRLSCYDIFSELSIVTKMCFFGLKPFGSEYRQTPDWLSVIHLASLLRCNLWIFKCNSDVFMVWHLWQSLPAAQLSGSQWFTRLSCYDVISGFSFLGGIVSWSDTFCSEYLQHNWVVLIELLVFHAMTQIAFCQSW